MSVPQYTMDELSPTLWRAYQILDEAVLSTRASESLNIVDQTSDKEVEDGSHFSHRASKKTSHTRLRGFETSQ